MRLKEFDYHLPKRLIAQQPIRPRDHSRLLVLERKSALSAGCAGCKIEHKHFYNIVDCLQAGDVLVLNNSKVFPARLIGKKKKTGGRIEVFLHQKIRGNLRQCLLGGHGRREGLEVKFNRGLECQVIKDNKDGTWNVKFNKSAKEMMRIVEKIGKTPLPPYIKRDSKRYPTSLKTSDVLDYQTVYADSKKVGSVAAPTAGFHFTKRLINKLKKKGVQFEYITLHVGLGTFAPVKVNNITKHKMHAEYVEVKKDVLQRIIKAKKEKRRIIAVGTTSVRTLEAIFSKKSHRVALEPLGGYKEWIDIFIYPGYKFKVVDGMITNFHLPKSTLLMLVMAFACTERSRRAGKENIDKAYKQAIKKKYRFYSYGDVMFIY